MCKIWAILTNKNLPKGRNFTYQEDPNTYESSEVVYVWVFPKIGVPQNGWFTMENPIKMDDDDLGVPLFSETPIYIYIDR